MKEVKQPAGEVTGTASWAGKLFTRGSFSALFLALGSE